MKIRLALLACSLAVAAFAADASGKWTFEAQGRQGQTMTTTITLKADGANLTGSVSGRQGDTDITNGKVDGDNVSFDVVREFNGNKFTTHYNGKVAGDELKLKIAVEGRENMNREVTAKRSSGT